MGGERSSLIVLRRGEGETVVDRPERTIRILADRDELTLSWFRYAAGLDGPDPHVHRLHTDAFYVLEGDLEIGLGPDVRRMTAAAGTFAAAPPNVVHTFRNRSDAMAVFLNVHAPSAGFGDMLRASRHGRSDEVAEFDQFDPPAAGGRPLSDAVFRGRGEGEAMPLGASTVVLKADAAETDGCFFLTEMVLEPGTLGTAPHPDNGLVDSFYVLAGTLSLQLGDDEVDAGPGDFALVPPATAHAFANESGERVRMLNFRVPGAARLPTPSGRSSAARAAHGAAARGRTLGERS